MKIMVEVEGKDNKELAAKLISLAGSLSGNPGTEAPKVTAKPPKVEVEADEDEDTEETEDAEEPEADEDEDAEESEADEDEDGETDEDEDAEEPEEKPAKKAKANGATLDEVKTVLKAYAKKFSREKAVKLLHKASGGIITVAELEPKQYATVIKAAEKALAK